jgi:hypothetical protein
MLASATGLGLLGAGMAGSNSASADVGSITPVEPGYRDRFEQGLGELLGGDREDYRRARRLAGVMDYIPGIGDAAGVADTVDAYNEGDYIGTGIGGLATLLGTYPIGWPRIIKSCKRV